MHRDLKPENLFLTRDGRVKILDFGIAKLTAGGEEHGAATVSMMTDVGVAVGTLGYMAPEQLRGETVDHRADLFAVGAILHEMIAGVSPFRRESRVQTVNAVLESDPPELATEIAPGIRRIVGRLLEKTPDARFQSARDLAFALSALSESTTSATGRVARGGKGTLTWTTVSAIALIAAALSAALTAAVSWRLRDAAPSAAPSVKRFLFSPPEEIGHIAIARDGSRIVYTGFRPQNPVVQLYQRRMDSLDATVIAGTEGSYSPFFSPDGNWVAFVAERKLKKVPLSGGQVVTLADLAPAILLQGTWTDDGTIVFAQREGSLMAVSAEGGTPRPLTKPDTQNGVIDHHAPFPLPGGGLLFTIHAGPERFRVAVREPNGTERVLIEDGYYARYLSSGHLVWGRPNGLYAATFDLASLQLTGAPVLVLERTLTIPTDGTVAFDVAQDGTLVYLSAVSLDGRQLVWVDRKGQPTPLPTPPRAYALPALSPDGSRLAVEIKEAGRSDIWMYVFATESFTPISTGGANTAPLWTPDSRRLAYAAQRGDERHIMMQSLDGTAPESLVMSRSNVLWPASWTPKGDRLLYVEEPPTSLNSVKMLRLGDSAPPETVLAAPPSYAQPHLSPDGQWITYMVFENSRPQVYIRRLGGGAPRRITPDGGGQPRWSRDGGELYYRRRGPFFRVPIGTAQQLEPGRVEKLFEENFISDAFNVADYDVSADGQRFLFVKRAEAEGARLPMHVVVNWFDELRKRVPADQ